MSDQPATAAHHQPGATALILLYRGIGMPHLHAKTATLPATIKKSQHTDAFTNCVSQNTTTKHRQPCSEGLSHYVFDEHELYRCILDCDQACLDSKLNDCDHPSQVESNTSSASAGGSDILRSHPVLLCRSKHANELYYEHECNCRGLILHKH